jgi:hypothetical protein
LCPALQIRAGSGRVAICRRAAVCGVALAGDGAGKSWRQQIMARGMSRKAAGLWLPDISHVGSCVVSLPRMRNVWRSRNLKLFSDIRRRRALCAAPVCLAAAGFLLSQAQAANAPGPLPQGQNPASLIGAMPLAAYRAVYDLTLAKAIGSKSPTSARGRIAFDFTGSACDGYVQNFRQLTELQPAEGPTRISDMRSLTFEDGEGRNFTFKTQTRIDSDEADEVDGRAQRPPLGPMSVDLVKPKAGKLDFDHDALFPTEHLKYILAAAKAGKNMLEVKVYDGSDNGDKIASTTTIIGKPIDSPAIEKAAHIPALESMRRWPVTISYFDEAKKDEAPNYLLSFDLYENGISRALRLDYGDFVLAGEMTSLEILPQSTTCTK